MAIRLASALVAGMHVGSSALGQPGQFVVAAPAATTDEAKPQPSFTLPAQSNDVKDSLDEFTRLVKHEQWDKAFKSLETITSKTATGYMDRGDGVLMPSRLLLRGLLAGLPPAGRNAYRLFYDSEAMALWDKAGGKGEAEALSTIVNNHLISSVGDRAADRLGDLYFEQANFEQAVSAWQSVSTYCPESKIPKAQLLVKIATALARAGRWSEFDTIKQTLVEHHPSDQVEVGGRRVAASQEIARLAAANDAGPAAAQSNSSTPDDLELPSTSEPSWQFHFQSKADPNNPNQAFALLDVYGRQRPNDFLIPAACDDKRVYVNLFGVEMAFDVATGKLVWRSGKLHLLQFQQNRQGILPERYSMSVSRGRTWSVLRDPQQANQGIGFALMVRDAATGKEVFNSRRTLSAWSILSPPYLAGLPDSGPDPAPVAIDGAPGAVAVNFPEGFGGAADKLQLNGESARVEGTNLRLTDQRRGRRASVFTRDPVEVTAFKTQFRLQLLPAAGFTADGVTFTIQGTGPTALGAEGDGLGYRGIKKSVAVKFDLFDKEMKKGVNSTGLCLNGEAPDGSKSINLDESGIDLHGGHDLDVRLVYDGTNLQATITDTVTRASHSQTYGVDIPGIVGGKTAYVGFTASTGFFTAIQNVVSWTYAAAAPRKVNVQTAGKIYLAASRTGQGRELAVLILDAKDGKLIKTINIGNYAVDQNQVYGDRICQPSFLLDQDRLYVDTSGGALVSLQPQTGNLDWAALYDSPPPAAGYYYNYEPPQLGISQPIRAAGLLFAKGMRSSRLLGVRADSVTLAWNRPVAKTAVILGADSERLYMGGEELVAYGLKTQELLWATQLPHSAGWSEPMLTKNRIYHFTSRGICEIDKQTGAVLKIFRGTDLDSLGGTLLVTPGAVVTVSNSGITAYARHAPAAGAESN